MMHSGEMIPSRKPHVQESLERFDEQIVRLEKVLNLHRERLASVMMVLPDGRKNDLSIPAVPVAPLAKEINERVAHLERMISQLEALTIDLEL